MAQQTDLNMLRLRSTETIGLGAVGAELVMWLPLNWMNGSLNGRSECARRVRVGTNCKSARIPIPCFPKGFSERRKALQHSPGSGRREPCLGICRSMMWLKIPEHATG